MTTAAMLIREIEALSEESMEEALDFVRFLRNKPIRTVNPSSISIEDAYGIFKDLKGMDTTIEREEEDRV